jgi:hypothetical protein
MSITIPKRVRVLDGITDPLGGSRENPLGARYEINQIGRASGIENWLPTLDTFRTFAAWNAVRSNRGNCF